MSIQQALISVSNKSNLIPFAKALAEMGIHLLSTGGTYKILKEEKIPVEEVSHYTGLQEMMDGRVKTLHPKIHGGILGRRGIDDEVMQQQNIRPIDLVIVNLYPFAETIAKPNCPFEEAVEQIDIGGPTLLRAAAKNHRDVGVIVDPKDYEKIIIELTAQKKLTDATRLSLAQKAFQHTSQYDTTIAAYLKTQLSETDSSNLISRPLFMNQEGGIQENKFPETFSLSLKKQQDLRYGENPHQQAAFYVETPAPTGTIASAQQLQGKELSFNNIADTDTALECVKSFTQPACVIIKHANPCGVALADNLLAAYDQAYATDPTSAFGGIIAFNKTLDEKTAQAILERQFVEVIIAPDISAEAKKCFSQKPNIRVLISGAWQTTEKGFHHYQRIHGGLLVQTNDQLLLDEKQLRCVTQRQPTEQEMQDLLFCWTVAKFVKSNAIVYAKNKQTIGIGAGQMSRVYSAKIANIKAQDEKLIVAGSVMASDAFFPFRDGIDAAAQAGITAVIQPGGSIRDEEVIAAANEANMAMLFTSVRHFRH